MQKTRQFDPPQARFRSTRPVPAVEAGAAALVVFLVPPVTPFLIEFMTPFLAGAALAAAPRFTTVPVLASLVSLLPLTLRALRVAGRDVGARGFVAATLLVRVAAVVLAELELVLEAAVTFLAAPARVAFAFSTMLDRTFPAADRVVELFNGEAGRAMPDLTGEAGRTRFARRELDEVGERICAGRTSAVAAARIRFLAFSACSNSFSLSPEMASLHHVSITKSRRVCTTHLMRFFARPVVFALGPATGAGLERVG